MKVLTHAIKWQGGALLPGNLSYLGLSIMGSTFTGFLPMVAESLGYCYKLKPCDTISRDMASAVIVTN